MVALLKVALVNFTLNEYDDDDDDDDDQMTAGKQFSIGPISKSGRKK